MIIIMVKWDANMRVLYFSHWVYLGLSSNQILMCLLFKVSQDGFEKSEQYQWKVDENKGRYLSKQMTLLLQKLFLSFSAL